MRQARGFAGGRGRGDSLIAEHTALCQGQGQLLFSPSEGASITQSSAGSLPPGRNTGRPWIRVIATNSTVLSPPWKPPCLQLDKENAEEGSEFSLSLLSVPRRELHTPVSHAHTTLSPFSINQAISISPNSVLTHLSHIPLYGTLEAYMGQTCGDTVPWTMVNDSRFLGKSRIFRWRPLTSHDWNFQGWGQAIWGGRLAPGLRSRASHACRHTNTHLHI